MLGIGRSVTVRALVAVLAAIASAAAGRETRADEPGGAGGAGGAAGGGFESAEPAVRHEHDVRPHRRRSGGDAMDADLRRRLEEEERRQKELMDEHNETLLLRLLRDASALPVRPIQIDSSPVETPSHAFLRAVAPRSGDPTAVVERRGFDRWFMGEVKREWRRRYRTDLARRRAAARRTWEHEIDDERCELDRRMDTSHVARWEAPFPSYWDGHPSGARREAIVSGERIELLRFGRLTVHNDARVAYDFRSVVYSVVPEPEAERKAARAPAPHTGLAAGNDPPRGNVYTGDGFTIDARVHLGTSTSAFATGFVKEIGGQLDWVFYDRYDRRRLFAMELDVEYEPDDAETSLALMFEVVRF